MKKQYHYLYKLILEETGEFYIGRHSTKNLKDGYMGSGNWTAGKNTLLKKEIISFHDTMEELILVEAEAIYDNFHHELNKNEHTPLKSTIEEKKSSQDKEKWQEAWLRKKEAERETLKEQKIRAEKEKEFQEKIEAGRSSQFYRLHSKEEEEKIVDEKINSGGDFEIDFTSYSYNMMKKLASHGININLDIIHDARMEEWSRQIKKLPSLFEKNEDRENKEEEEEEKSEADLIKEEIVKKLEEYGVNHVNLILRQIFSLQHMYYYFNYGFKLRVVKVIYDELSGFSSGTPHKKILEKSVEYLSHGQRRLVSVDSVRHSVHDENSQIAEVLKDTPFGRTYCVFHNKHDFFHGEFMPEYKNYSDPDERQYWEEDQVLFRLNKSCSYKLYFCESEIDDLGDAWFTVAKNDTIAKKVWAEYNDYEEDEYWSITAFPVVEVPDHVMDYFLKEAENNPDSFFEHSKGYLANIGIIEDSGIEIIGDEQPYTFVYKGITFKEGEYDAKIIEIHKSLISETQKNAQP